MDCEVVLVVIVCVFVCNKYRSHFQYIAIEGGVYKQERVIFMSSSFEQFKYANPIHTQHSHTPNL